MARLANDGRGRIGGREKGTPNKPQPRFGVWVAGILGKQRKKIEQQLERGGDNTELLCTLILASSIDRLTDQLATMQGKVDDQITINPMEQ